MEARVPDDTRAIGLATLVYELMTNREGVSPRDFTARFSIKERTFRAWKKDLEDRFEPFFDAHGRTLLRTKGRGEQRRIFLSNHLDSAESRDLASACVLAQLARHVLPADGRPFDALRFLEQEDNANAARWMNLDLGRKLYTNTTSRFDYEQHARASAALIEATLESRQVSLTYRPPGQTGHIFDLDPLSIVHYRDTLILLGRHHADQSIKHFSMIHVESVRPKSTYFNYPDEEEYHPSNHFDGYFGPIMSTDSEPIEVEIIFAHSPWLSIFLCERAWHPTQTFTELEDGRLLMKFSVRSMDLVWPWVRSFGEQAELVRPSAP